MSILIFIIFLTLFIGLFLFAQSNQPTLERDFELEYLFSNLENNLDHAPDTDIAFLKDYRVNATRLDRFANDFALGNVDLDTYVFESVDDAHGIGVDADGYDSCLYLRGASGIITLSNGDLAIGTMRDGTSCHEMIASSRNPCEEYKEAISLFKPVLFDTGNPDTNRIIQMNIVVCKR